MRVSPIQRMAAVIMIVMLVFWFYNKQSQRYSGSRPMILGTETVLVSGNPEADKLFLERVLDMEVTDISFNTLVFREGLVLKGSAADSVRLPDTLLLRTDRIRDVWNNVIASDVRVIYPPRQDRHELAAAFSLPGGMPVRVISRK